MYLFIDGFIDLYIMYLYIYIFIFTLWYDVSHAMGFRGWGRNSTKYPSLTHSLCYTINLRIKPGLNTFFPYIRSLTSLSHCSKSCHCFSVRIRGEVQRREYVQLL